MSEKCICGFEGSPRHRDIYDCVEYEEEKSGKIKGKWMIDWMKRSKISEEKRKPSGFNSWVDSAEKKDNNNE